MEEAMKTYDKKYKEERPWGNFEQFTHNEISTVKILNVIPNQELSLQYHNHRDEFWRVISGKPIIVLGEETIPAKEGDEFFIPRGTKHRIKTEEHPGSLLEISFGNFDENDIVRLEDKYNRS